MDDDLLMRRVASGDTRAFEQIVRRYERSLGQFALRLLGNVDDSRDAVQDAFLGLWRSREAYRPCGKLKSYLYRLAHNACVDQRSRQRPAVSLYEIGDAVGTENTPASVEVDGLAQAVRDAVLSLPEDQRAVFVLSCYDGLSYSEIGEIVGCPVGTVASRKRLAAQALRKRLAAWED